MANKKTKTAKKKTAKEIKALIEPIIANFDPTPTLVNEDFPLRWESPIFQKTTLILTKVMSVQMAVN